MSQQAYHRISELFTALAQEYYELAESTTHVEMTGSDYIASVDQPDTGTGTDPVITNTPAEIFNSGADVAAVFAPATPTYKMLPAAGDWTREGLLASGQGWTDENLVSNNMMEIIPTAAPAPKPPAVPVPVPTPQAAATPTPDAIETDAAGLPWDARIHSGGRTKKANGEWVARKGVQAAIVAQVTAELRQKPAGGAPFVPQPAAHVPLAQSAAGAPPPPAPAPPAPGAGLTKEQVLAAAQAAASLRAAQEAAPVPGPNANAAPTDAKSLMEWVSVNGYGPHMNAVATMLGLAGFGLILQPENAKYIQTAYTTFLALGKPA